MKTTRSWLNAILATTVLVGAAALVPAHAAGSGHRHADGGMMFMGRGMERMLDGVKASDEQRTQIRQIATAARADMKAERESTQALRKQMHDLFMQPNVDANVAESLRQQMLAQHDRRSQRTMQAMIDVSRVLSPEQRLQIGEHMKRRGEHMRQHREMRQSGHRQPG